MREPTTVAALYALAFVLGLRHGFDADHLAVIDGITRLNADRRPRLARASGALFSLGHGSVILAVVVGANLLAGHWSIPAWLELSGTLISITFLLALALLNLLAVARTPRGEIVRPQGLRAHWLANTPLLATSLGVLFTGLLFAISFDSVSQALLFAVVGTSLGGARVALLAGMLFVAGMIMVDGANGLWMARLVRSTSRGAAPASRIMASAVGLISLVVCSLAFCDAVVPAIANWSDAHGLWIGAAIVATMTTTALAALALTRRSPAGGAR